MYCKNCGHQLDDNAIYCPACGVATDNFYKNRPNGNTAGPNYGANGGYAPPPPVNPADTAGIGWSVLCFFFPVVGLILFLVWQDTLPLRARACGKGALIGVIVEVAFGLLTTIIFLVIFFSVGVSLV
ncbi:MAG TPA: zinc ribbon domain-containing protein [Candidatus Coproplasma excrementigallinarum]|uniref:Zinc ribbon domain-containing protein n=1 Tax=Candidatus Coproplasma excrementigallinarum TaxID=2840747 RepID=A0A9D1MJ73_9FIRM|nr:zinc ribbon domain-containing protein [Candidatus Coproplasma excrementigallinarum]